MLRGIRARLLGLVIVTVVPFMALTGVGLWMQWRNDRDQAYKNAQVEARLLAAAVDDQLGNIENLLAGLSRAVSTDPADSDTNDATLRNVKPELPSYVSNILLFDLDGDNIGTSWDGAGGRNFAGDRDYFLDVVHGQRFAIGQPLIGRTTGTLLITIARPVENHGRLAAVLAVGIKPEHFEQALRAHPLPTDSVVEVVNEYGAVISRNPNAPADQEAPGSAHNPNRRSARWSDHVARITASATVQHVPWRVSVSLPTNVAFANVISRLLWGIVAGATALVVAVALAWAFASRITRPLRELTRDASALAGGDFAHRTALRGTDEVGALASTFNTMAASLEERHRELVTARTAAAAEAAERARFAEMERQAKDTLAAVIDTSPAAIVCSDLERRVVVWNQAAERIFGYAANEVIGRPIDLVWPGGAEQSQQLFQHAVAAQSIRGVELVGRAKSGPVDIRVAATAMHRVDGSAWGIAWAFDDITDRKNAEARLKRSAHFDPLTGLPNRRAMRDELDVILAGDRSHAIVLVDLDGFKEVNDSAGHSSGDQLLMEVARRLTRVCESRGKSFRLGGDEFIVIMEGCGDPRIVAERVEAILQELSQPYDVNEHVHLIGASAGIAIAPNNGTSVDELIVNADLALYQVKSDGGHAYRFFVPAFRAQAHARRGLRQELRRAFAENEFELYYQPQIRLADGAVVGAEALLRWQHPVQGQVGPASFIDALAESAMAPEIGRWILREACQKAASWRTAGKLARIGINLFPIQSRDPMLFADVEEALQSSGLPAESLELEVTENAALDKDSAIIPFQRLHARGVSLAFDDFGTGYASLSYLTRFPISRIKIDCSFVARITEHSEDKAIVRSLIAMAHNLGLAITAEGVETAEQAAFLRMEQCEEAQGFYYAKPLSAAEFEAYLHTTKSALETDSDKAAFRQRHRRAADAGRAG